MEVGPSITSHHLWTTQRRSLVSLQHLLCSTVQYFTYFSHLKFSCSLEQLCMINYPPENPLFSFLLIVGTLSEHLFVSEVDKNKVVSKWGMSLLAYTFLKSQAGKRRQEWICFCSYFFKVLMWINLFAPWWLYLFPVLTWLLWLKWMWHFSFLVFLIKPTEKGSSLMTVSPSN